MTIKTPIGYTTRDEIFVRDRNIATEILGQLDFIDMIYVAGGQTPIAPMKRMANTLMVAVTDHGVTLFSVRIATPYSSGKPFGPYVDKKADHP